MVKMHENYQRIPAARSIKAESLQRVQAKITGYSLFPIDPYGF